MPQRLDYIPACTPGNKPCGRRCIPASKDCNRSEMQRLNQSSFNWGSASLGTGLAASALSLSTNSLKPPGATGFYPGDRGYKRVVAANTLKKASDVTGVISAVQALRAIHKQYQVHKERKSRKRKDAISDRLDFKKPLNCGVKTYQCGSRCIPRDQVCNITKAQLVARAGLGVEAVGALAGVVGANTHSKKLEAIGAGLRVAGNIAQTAGSQKLATEYFKQGDYGRAALYQGLGAGSLVKAGIGSTSLSARLRNIQKHSNQNRTVAQL